MFRYAFSSTTNSEPNIRKQFGRTACIFRIRFSITVFTPNVIQRGLLYACYHRFPHCTTITASVPMYPSLVLTRHDTYPGNTAFLLPSLPQSRRRVVHELVPRIPDDP